MGRTADQASKTDDRADASAQRRNRRLEARRAEILLAAAEVFGEVGYEAATLEAVGERVGLSKPSLYYYVRGKEDLLAQILLDVLARVGAGVVASDPGDDPAQRLRALCRSHVRVICADARGRLIGRYGEMRERATELARTDGSYRRKFEVIVADGVAQGMFRPVDLTVFGWTLMLSLNAVASWWTQDDGRSPDEVADEILSYFLEGLAVA